MAEFNNQPILTYTIDRERRDIDVAGDIARLVPDASPFTVILMRAKKKPTQTAEFAWYDEEPGGYQTLINNAAGYTATDTSLVVDDGTIFAPKDIIKVPRTGEVMFVSAVSTNTITVVRGYGTTVAAALVDDDPLLRLGNAMEENSSAPLAKLKQPSKGFNYTQIFRTVFDQSMTSASESLKTNETERNRLRKSKALDHRLDLERAILFGERKEDTANKRRTTGGLLSFITSNVKDAQGTLTEDEFEDFCEMLFAYGSGRKLLVCSSKVISVINRFGRDKLQTQSGESTYGIRMNQYTSAHGDLYIVKSRALDGPYSGYAIGVDMDYIAYRPLAGRDTTLKTNIQNNDVDGWMDEYLTEAGLEVRLEKTHAILKGVTS
jgi:hypothetical protein